MRLPRVRFTIKRAMLAVAVLALIMGGARVAWLRDAYRKAAAHYAAMEKLQREFQRFTVEDAAAEEELAIAFDMKVAAEGKERTQPPKPGPCNRSSTTTPRCDTSMSEPLPAPGCLSIRIRLCPSRIEDVAVVSYGFKENSACCRVRRLTTSGCVAARFVDRHGNGVKRERSEEPKTGIGS